jgi:hypothetical protein
VLTLTSTDEAIKWPDLDNNQHSAAPVEPKNPFANNAAAGSDLESARSASRAGGYAPTMHSMSTADVHYADPYAVPALPHLNPSQPSQYRDDIHGGMGGGAFYDPYGGPVPRSIAEPVTQGLPEVIPMTQFNAGSNMAFDPARVGSPGPGPGPGRMMSPAPTMNPNMNMGYGGAPSMRSGSPGPGMAYGGGRASPGPEQAYGNGYR